MTKKIAAGVIVFLLILQLVPLSRTNPPEEQPLNAPDPVLAILKRSCYDCHSHATRWPWYARVAPVSFFITHHVNEGRRKLNFSTWGTYTIQRMEHKLEEVWEEVEKGNMPLSSYLWLHGDAEITEKGKQILKQWVETERARLMSPDSTATKKESFVP